MAVVQEYVSKVMVTMCRICWIEVGCVIVAGYLEVDKDVCLLLKQIPKLVWETIVEICLHVLITGARLYGMATFSRRRLVW